MNESLWFHDVLRQEGLDVPVRGGFEIRSRNVGLDEGPAAVLRLLESFGGGGWVCFTDRVEELGHGEKPSPGIPLQAEFCSRDRKRSLHLRQAAEGWQFVEIERKEGAGFDQWIFRRSYRHIDGARSVDYEVAWRPEPETGVWQPWCFRFMGFSEGGCTK